MSSLAPNDVDPGLADVLAFLDNFDTAADHTSPDSNSSDANHDSPSSPRAPAVSAAIARKRRVSSATSRRCQHKKRAERLALRVQVEALEKRLAELSRSRHKRTNSPSDPVQELRVAAEWLERLVEESRRREEAETRNRKLKSVLAQQRQEAKAVRRLLRDVTFWQSLHAVKRPLGPRNADLVDFQDTVVDDLAASMGQMILDSNAVLENMEVSKDLLIPGTPTVQWDAVTGLPYVEVRISIPVRMGAMEATKVIWGFKIAADYRLQRKRMTPNGLLKDAAMTLDTAQSTVDVDILSLTRMYEEERRVRCIWATRLFPNLSDEKLSICENGWFLVTDTPMGAVLQSLGATMHANFTAIGKGYPSQKLPESGRFQCDERT